ncbi:transient receptor potential cation channel subfamily M member 2 isoform X1 [Pantherophis guttatus]|uniref:Transient receptor potential cation channel subfamily M member 2 isoform X1 n=2 Tax=Pantherophis guttatus TaxID=94885 RepID=A0ABM3YSI1_PANGU|nr:transient receptor potential cation channel subfamily M member 2 isoform X1 [Pantherophis guttatus]XP_060539080.1 transient receptor potential cation channel subfamily M member 2 isoform X1 [Pantherophis guttatus]XP_060539081.1 transient receptor potential cation channel subfamily M member 2 isoform X1 [Pantherophis guttatus]
MIDPTNIAMAGPGLRIPMELNKIHHDEGYPLDLENYYDITMVSNFRRSISPSSRSKRRAHFSPSINEKENLRLWIPENIQKKECVYFIESSQLSDSGKVACECGYLKEEHLEEAIKPVMFQGKEWDPRRHVQEMPTDAFGDITFTGLGQKVGKYVRVSSSTSPKTLYQLITQYWGLDIPNLLISVTGGAKNFSMKMRLKNIFRQGLAKVVQTTGAWIITGGSHTGVMKQVGEALQDFIMSSTYKGEIVAIGIASWGTVHNRNSLICRTGSFPAEYILDEETQGSLSCLDSNHSHFILVDDGTHGKYGVEIPLRTKLEKYISEQTKVKEGVAIKIPIVCVVLEGGPGTLDTIYNAINNGTPCVIVEGSGRVADVIAQVSNLPSHKISICLIQKKLSIFFKDSYELFTENKIVEWTKKIQDIVRNKQLLTIFREGKDGQQDIDVAILQAMLKASRCHDHFGHENWDYQLKLAVAWNRVDIARSEIFTEDHEWKPFDLHPMMAAALIANKPEFVKLFFEQGIQLKEFVTWDTLLYLYENMATSSVFYGKLQKVLLEEKERAAISKMPRIQLHHVSQVLRELLGDFTQQLYPKLKNAEKPHLPIPVPQNKMQGVQLQAFYRHSAAQTPFSIDPVRDLLIWAIVQNRKELADIIWTQSRDCIAAALACSNILKEISKEENDTDSCEEMLTLAEKYEHRAVGVFTECCRKDEERAQNLLIRVSDAWGKTTCLQLALEGKNMKFVSHGGVQAFLTRVWWGKLSVDNGICQVILCMLFFPLLYTGLITFRKKRIQPTTDLNRFRAFFTAPVVIFHLNILSYFSFLCLYAFVLMTDFQSTPSWPEYVIYFWLFSLVCEEARQLFCDPDGFGLVKMASLYFSDFWNKLDACAILIFIVGLVCRWFPATLYPGRIVLSLAFIIFCLRLLHIFTISKTLGPKIIIVKRMMKDIFFFLFLLAVWIVSFGVAKQAILIHNEKRVDWIFRGVFYHSYLTLFGQIPSYVDGVNFNFDQCSPNGTDPYKPKCPESSEANKKPIFPEWLTVILLCLYLLFTNILLLNLLIAMFNYTFQQVQEHTDQIWKFQRHDLIEEYNGRPPAPPPFILLNHLQILVKRVFLQKPTTRHKQLKKKFEKNEEAALLSWEMYLKENYLQLQQSQQKHTPEQKIQHITDRVDKLTEMLDLDQGKMMKLLEQRLLHLEEQTFQFAKALQWIVQSLSNSGFGTEEDIPVLVPSRAAETKEPQAEEISESLFTLSHVSSRNLLYPKSTVIRFAVPEEKVPWETEFDIYNPPFYSSETQEDITPKFLRDNLENLSRINFNSLDGEINRQSFHGTYTVKDGLPLNPMGRTGLRGQGILRFFGPNHALHPVVTRWRRNVDGSIYRKNLKKMLEVLVVKFPFLDNWALLGGSLEPGEALPQKIKQVLRREFWPQFQKLLNQGTEIYKGYLDDPRNTDNAWIETVAISVHFEDQNDVEMKRLNSFLQGCDFEVFVRWQVVDKKIPLYVNHKELLRKATVLLRAYF